jgi:hypothetical protein
MSIFERLFATREYVTPKREDIHKAIAADIKEHRKPWEGPLPKKIRLHVTVEERNVKDNTLVEPPESVIIYTSNAGAREFPLPWAQEAVPTTLGLVVQKLEQLMHRPQLPPPRAQEPAHA